MRAEIKESLDLYAKEGRPTGGYLEAVLSNDLMQAMARADRESLDEMFEVCSYVYNDMPSACHGSPTKVHAWIKAHFEARQGTKV